MEKEKVAEEPCVSVESYEGVCAYHRNLSV